MSNTGMPPLDATSGTLSVGVIVNVVIDLDQLAQAHLNGAQTGAQAVALVTEALRNGLEKAVPRSSGVTVTNVSAPMVVHAPKKES
jgi:hypothetical protein